MTANATAATHCPICGALADETMLSLRFSQKEHLPSDVALKLCRACDFAYISPADQAAYAAYYASTKNDLIHEEKDVAQENGLVLTQAPVFAPLLEKRARLEILDYGCGGGDLIKLLAARYPQHRYTGFDFHAIREATDLPNVSFTTDLDGLNKKFDLIVMSHVLEHLADFAPLEALVALLEDDGQLYIEVPNPSGYAHSLQKEFLFFIDRIHLSHFSAKSLLVLGERLKLQLQQYGKLALPYREATTYPSHYCFFKKSHGAMLEDLAAYVLVEQNRPSPLASLAAELPVLVYGFGDNFFRCRSGGPLKGRRILGVIDQRAAELNASQYRTEYTFLTLDEALAAHPDAPIIVTISWGAGELVRQLQTKTRAPVYVV